MPKYRLDNSLIEYIKSLGWDLDHNPDGSYAIKQPPTKLTTETPPKEFIPDEPLKIPKEPKRPTRFHI